MTTPTAPTAPKIQIEAGAIFALTSIGRIDLEPSHKQWRRRLAWWRGKQGRRVLTGWRLTPALALAAALKTASVGRG